MIYEAYGWIHLTAKLLLGRVHKPRFRMVDFCDEVNTYNNSNVWFNESKYKKGNCQIKKIDAFPVENVIPKRAFLELKDSFTKKRQKHTMGIDEDLAYEFWMCFIKNSVIPEGYKNNGLSYAGYILDCESWCLPSWIWTNAAVVRLLCILDLVCAKAIVERLLEMQCECGGWIVRYDYTANGIVPMLAPNDSAYLANNGILNAFKFTGEEKYLNAAEKCANWIIRTARHDGLVWLGMDVFSKVWIKDKNIVDIGFTAGFFAELYKITSNIKYKDFLERFTNKYIYLFRKKNGSFATSINAREEQIGGAFGRGQAWALEGLIPAYEILQTDELKETINGIVDNLLKNQKSNGAWPYNLDRKLMGLDCKATSVIGYNLMKWYPYSSKKKEIKIAVSNAINWCLNNTVSDNSNARGGIFS